MTTMAVLTHDTVAVGDQLPVLTYDVTATTVVVGALATRDTRPQHHDFHFATERNGVRDIFMNAPNQAAWFERYLTDWSGPHGRLGRVSFRMHDSVFPGDTMSMAGRITGTSIDDVGCGWVEVDVVLQVGDRMCTTCAARIALPTAPTDNPWSRKGDQWQPQPQT
jgi:hydroxyacyl-ACP dehydratase HTD2-like protein with hotdog domain